jgi:hypothetical protein
MPFSTGDIKVSNNFQANVAKPLDAKALVDDSIDLSDIDFPYEGLVVYVKNDDAFWYYDGTSFFPFGGDDFISQNENVFDNF